MTPDFLSGVADGYIKLTVLSREPRDAVAYVLVGHIDARAIVQTWIGLAFVVIGFTAVSYIILGKKEIYLKHGRTRTYVVGNCSGRLLE